jgi:D-alanyl-D-alanine carboxypeptidase
MIHPHTKSFLIRWLQPAVIAFLALLLVYNYFQIASLKRSVSTLRSELSSATEVLSSNVIYLTENLGTLREQTTGNLATTQQNIDAVKALLGGVEKTVGSISGAVGNLQKLSDVEKEILKKYSKVYFLSENYVPAHLTVIPEEYVYTAGRQEQFLSGAWVHLKNLLDAAKKDGVVLYVKSGYRSFTEQKSLKSAYSVTYGAGTANAFSADQGYSEHQLGSTVDFITTGMNGQLTTAFDKTGAYIWLTNNAHKYGFTLSYSKGNKYYMYEPWHWRYVGVQLATFLHDNNINFYEMEQREVDKFLVSVFD